MSRASVPPCSYFNKLLKQENQTSPHILWPLGGHVGFLPPVLVGPSNHQLDVRCLSPEFNLLPQIHEGLTTDACLAGVVDEWGVNEWSLPADDSHPVHQWCYDSAGYVLESWSWFHCRVATVNLFLILISIFILCTVSVLSASLRGWAAPLCCRWVHWHCWYHVLYLAHCVHKKKRRTTVCSRGVSTPYIMLCVWGCVRATGCL